MDKNARIFVAGHSGLVGSALTRRLQAGGFSTLLTATRDQLDLRDQAAVSYWFRANRPDYVFLAGSNCYSCLLNLSPQSVLRASWAVGGSFVNASATA